ncbi:cysteine hydrolase family protein [Candidatus Pantoea multigeneris]|uniref:Cysteine hydrolase n=1 Tax=Candidatus Pantoea multigeneris TaxID=2608357 RepID=A0ABX0RH32_9GAMM|nr:isochorismatase family cysteine hydrolase [Pantoea multigeneris]NIF24028.1 cysteine hydrolase [Pantoea multigeneris]
MTTIKKFEPVKSALLIMDYQRLILENYLSEKTAADVLAKTAALADAAREAEIKVIYIAVGFREGHPEISSKNALFSGVKKNGLLVTGAPESEIHPDVSPQAGEPVIIKHRIGAFSFTGLDMILKANGIQTLIMAGLTTSGVVLSSVRQAFDLDFNLIIAADCCGDADDYIHSVLINSILPQHAEVQVAAELIKRMSASKN